VLLTRHATSEGPRWALDRQYLPGAFSLARWLEDSTRRLPPTSGEPAEAPLTAPLDATHEVWAAGVTYARSREERETESVAADVYARVYSADRPEIFFKASAARTVGHGQPIRVRADSDWNVPEPELVLVIDARGRIAGYTAGNDVSSRRIEGENPLYLPQAKCYEGACAVGPGIRLLDPAVDLGDIKISLEIVRGSEEVFRGSTRTAAMKRSFSDLVAYLYRELSFPGGTFLMTGTGIIPPAEFTLYPDDRVSVTVGELRLENPVGR
jgi:2-dehydro-3-deoxy-D-arabinonate dehydratase